MEVSLHGNEVVHANKKERPWAPFTFLILLVVLLAACIFSIVAAIWSQSECSMSQASAAAMFALMWTCGLLVGLPVGWTLNHLPSNSSHVTQLCDTEAGSDDKAEAVSASFQTQRVFPPWVRSSTAGSNGLSRSTSLPTFGPSTSERQYKRARPSQLKSYLKKVREQAAKKDGQEVAKKDAEEVARASGVLPSASRTLASLTRSLSLAFRQRWGQDSVELPNMAPKVVEVAGAEDVEQGVEMEGAGNVEQGVENIELVMSQVQCTRSEAAAALRADDNDIVEAIMHLSI